MSKPGRILAIDYGKSKIGLAISDETAQLVFGRGIIESGLAIKKIIGLCETEKVAKIVIGLPLNLKGEDTPQTIKIRNFGEELKKLIETEIVFQDESFSSFEANNILQSLNIKSKNRKQHEDELAAILILKRYLSI